jgi:hypothetical protein
MKNNGKTMENNGNTMGTQWKPTRNHRKLWFKQEMLGNHRENGDWKPRKMGFDKKNDPVNYCTLTN